MTVLQDGHRGRRRGLVRHAKRSADAWQPEQLILVSIERGGVQICEGEVRYPAAWLRP